MQKDEITKLERRIFIIDLELQRMKETYLPFYESLLDTISKIRSGKMKWHKYDEVF